MEKASYSDSGTKIMLIDWLFYPFNPMAIQSGGKYP